MKRLGKTLIVIALVLVVLDYGWMYLWELRIEPAGNPIQLFFMAIPYQFSRIFYFVHLFTATHMNLFWLGIALWISQRGDDR